MEVNTFETSRYETPPGAALNNIKAHKKLRTGMCRPRWVLSENCNFLLQKCLAYNFVSDTLAINLQRVRP